MSNPKDAFQELVRILSSRDNQVLEIEIIPPSLGASFLQDGCSVGIAKKALVQAFTVARQIFFDRLIPLSENDLQVSISEAQYGNADSVITEVILLFDCEHLTACNWRKRRLRAALACNKTAVAQELLEAELTLMSSYQCSPLHRHTKSPTLWHHRLWVVGHLLGNRHWGSGELLELQRTELDGVLRAGELHPKNYYAFNYMRQLCVLLSDTVASVAEQPIWKTESALSIIDPVINWCLANPRDISGWSFGIYVLSNVAGPQYRVRTISRVVEFALNIGWEGESLWTFVDHASGQFGLESVVEDTMALHSGQATRFSDSPTAPEGRHNKSWQTWLARARVCREAEGQRQSM
ncbi:Protein prenyltransferase [Penicillium bovifimosum]|uniref:Protein prenyltransferase n=1 Tax=Penicillium bovifimosum TaxID=126998 RepID=A0A9W9LA31_9EURO|nr:Protein prenyltransferase [Penicillium bovifimosum]KAJ5144077.1 Protein prenyltransferase [Penicillium bovifimosum]